jgi:hypothetical protein
MLAQEGLYRCLIGTEIFTAFFNTSKTMMTGRFYAGKDARLKAEDFKISMIDNNSPIVKSINNKETAVFDLTERSFQISLLKNQSHFKTAIISPILTRDLVIGAYFIARANDSSFSEKEIAWFEQIVIYVGQAFENSKK